MKNQSAKKLVRMSTNLQCDVLDLTRKPKKLTCDELEGCIVVLTNIATTLRIALEIEEQSFGR